jgi:rieske iron-sulfur protein
MTNDDSSEPEETQGSLVEREEGGSWYEPSEMSRRNVVKWLGVLSGGISISSIAVSAVYGISDAGLASLSDQLYTKGTHLVDQQGNRIHMDALPPGKGKKMLVLPEQSEGKPVKTTEATTLLLRYTEDTYKKPTNLDWTAKGYVAYSMVCTHAGCLVRDRSNGHLHCPCHASEYEAEAGAKVKGGPAPRPLPQLPIGVSKNGKLMVATGPFEGPIGPK